MENQSNFFRTARNSLSVILVIFFIAWGVIYIAENPDNLTTLKNISISSLILLGGLGLMKLGAMGMFTWINLGALNIHLGFWEWYGLSAMTAMGNYLVAFRGGAAIRGVYLKSKYNLPYSLFLSTVASLYLLTFPTNATLGLIAIAGIYFGLRISQPTLALILLVCVVGPIAFLAVIKRVPRFSGRWTSRLNLIIDGWKVLTKNPSTIIKLVLASILNSVTTVLMIHFSFYALGIKLPLLQSSVLGILYLISAMVPITPAGMGFAEAALVLTSSAFGLDSTTNILAAGLNRSVMLIMSLILGPLFTYVLGRKSNKRISLFNLQAMSADKPSKNS